MSKKHFVELAARLKNLRPGGENRYATPKLKHIAAGRMAQWRDTVNAVANFCAAQNGNFDRQRFLTAYGLED